MATNQTTSKEMNFPQEVKSAGLSSPPRKHMKSLLVAPQILVRILAIVFTVAAISVLVTSNQVIMLFGFSFMVRYNYTSAFKFLLGVDVAVCAFSVCSLICVYVLCRSGSSHPKNYFFLFLHDMVMMVLMMSGCAAATAVGYIGRYGEKKVGWNAVYDNAEKFCNQVLVSVLLSYMVFIFYLALTTLSAHKLTSQAM